MQKITGEGKVFIDCLGSPLKVDINNRDAVLVDEKCFICMGKDLENKINQNVSCANIFGGEGLSLIEISGPCIVYMNSVNL